MLKINTVETYHTTQIKNKQYVVDASFYKSALISGRYYSDIRV